MRSIEVMSHPDVANRAEPDISHLSRGCTCQIRPTDRLDQLQVNCESQIKMARSERHIFIVHYLAIHQFTLVGTNFHTGRLANA